MISTTKHIYVTALYKGRERYVFLYDREHVTEVLRMLGRFASNDDLSLTWFDAALLSNTIRNAVREDA